jgi:hypothetical protein
METIRIPLFVKNMGHRVLSHILNIEEGEALDLINGNLALDLQRLKVLSDFIQICRQLRMQSIDEGDVDFSVFHGLPQIVQNDRHIFNIWREQLGGKNFSPTSIDPLVAIASRLALEIYPLFLIKLPSSSHLFINTFSYLSLIFCMFNEHKLLFKEIMKDPSISKIFSQVGENEIDTQGQYMASSGRGGSIQLAVFPSTLIANAYELMRLRGLVSQEKLVEAVEEVVNMIRQVAEGNLIKVPVFVGFHNVGLDDIDLLEIEWGKIRAYSEEFMELIPQEARPSMLGGEKKYLGFIFEAEYPYKVDFDPTQGNAMWPPELELARTNLDMLQENVSLTFALSIERDPPIGITPAWTLIVDPLSQGTNISWSHRPHSPMPHYLLCSGQQESLKHWASVIKGSGDGKIRIAIRRILSSINGRMNPIDGFVDSVIAWENLFGGDAELSYRISISISKLLEESKQRRLELQKKIVNYYNDRSKIVHGVKDITHDEAVRKRNECLSIALAAIKKLYEEHQDLLSDPDRSKKLALQ